MTESLTATTIALAILTFIISAIVYTIQRRSQYDRAFRDCTKALHSKNPIEQTTAAILLRSYLKRRWFTLFSHSYSKEAKNLMVALLRQPIPVSLQKTIADGFSFVKDMNGQDMQYVNMLDVSIKPLSAIKFETTNMPFYKYIRNSMHHADFFHSVIQESNINFVDAKGAVFYCSLLSYTRFHNCILDGADFRCTNVTGVIFDQDCSLEGAKFGGAVGVNSALVKIGKKESRCLSYYLDKDGIYHSEGSTDKYSDTSGKLNIFISKLGAMDSQQTLHYRSVRSILEEFDGVNIDSIERDDYTSISQLTDVATKMDKSDGCVIFAFEYLHVNAGHIHKNIIGKDCQIVKDKVFASPWLHIETAIANGKRMPCLIIYDKDLCRDGMFDDNIVLADKNLFAIPYSDNFTSSDKEITKWIGNVREYHYNRNDMKNKLRRDSEQSHE